MRNLTPGLILALATIVPASAQSPAPAKRPAAPAAAKAHAATTPKPDPKPAPTAAAAAATTADPVVITIGNERVTKSQYEALIAALPEQARANAAGPAKRQFAEQYAELKTLAQEARRRGIDRKPEFQQKLALQSENLLASDLYGSFKPTDADVRSYYDQHKSDFDQVKASHILIRFKGSPVGVRKDQKELTEEEALAKAKEVRQKIAAGGNFAELAKTESDDTGSGQNGGALGSFGHKQMVEPFEQAAFALPVGQVSEPVKTQFGYHLIKVEERTSKTFDEVKGQIEQQLKPEIAKKAIDDIKKVNPVVVNEDYFGKATPPVAVQAGVQQ